METSQSPPLMLYFRSLESEQAEELETSIVSSIGSTSVNTSETSVPVPVTADTWSTSFLSGPFPTEAFSGDRELSFCLIMAEVGNDLQSGLSWVKTKPGDLPDGAISVRPDVYICRAWYEGEQIPGKYVPPLSAACIPYAGQEHQVTDFEVLCDTSIPGWSCW
nr:unnamed protein product [Spirometra erinaceieuropaei]